MPLLISACIAKKRSAVEIADDQLQSRQEATTLDRVHAAMLLQAVQFSLHAYYLVLDRKVDLLFAVVNLARHLSADPEGVLRATNQKFERRFAAIERALAEKGKAPQDATLAEMDALWDEAKAEEALASPGAIPPPADLDR